MMSRSGASSEWELLPYFVLRMAGFPFGCLQVLADEDVALAARELLRCERETGRAVRDAAAAARALPAGQRGSRPVKRLLRVMQRRLPATRDEAEVAASVPDPGVVTLYAAYRRAWAAEGATRELFAQAHDAALYRTGAAALRLFHTEPLLRDMLLITNADAFEPLTRWLDSRAERATGGEWRKLVSSDRAKLDILARYLQRACAKNDTHSHFGPFAPGVFDTGVDGIHWRVIPLRRYPQLSRWAAEALLAKFSAGADRTALLAPRRAPGATIRGASLEVLDFDYSARCEDVRDIVQVRPAVPIGAAEQAVFPHCDGGHTVEEILGLACQGGVQLSRTELLASLEWLVGQGAVVVGPEFPVGVGDSLTVLREFADRAADAEWRTTLGSIQAALDELATGGPSARVHAVRALANSFTSETGLPPSRNKGRFYGDRSVFYEECTSWCGDLAAGRPVTELLTRDLAPVYDLFLLRPRVRFLGEKEMMAGWFRQRFGAGARVGALDYLQAYLADVERLAPGYAAVERKVAETGQRADALLLPTSDSLPMHRVAPQFFAAAIEAISPPVPALCNPDVMLVAPSVRHLREGHYQAIIGDLHAVEEVISHQTFAPFMERQFTDYGDTIIAAYQRLLADDEEIVDVIQRHHNKAYIQTALPCRDVEAWGRSPKKRSDVLALADLTVLDSTGGLRLAAGGNGGFLRLMALPFGQLAVRPNPFAVFSFPRSWGGLALEGDGCAHLPRLEVGRVVVQRELWRVPASALSAASDQAAFLGVQRLREELSLPRHIYAKLPHETKPIYCDLDSPLLARQLARMASGDTGSVQLTEMLPAPPDLWLEDEGGHYTTEIRFAVTSPGGRRGRPGS